MPNNFSESGEPMVMDECTRCGATPAKGTEYIRNGVRIFKCEDCGKSMHNGYLESAHKVQLENKIGHEKATENRDRFWRENQQKQEQDFERLQHEPGAEAEKVWSIDYATKKWRFDKVQTDA